MLDGFARLVEEAISHDDMLDRTLREMRFGRPDDIAMQFGAERIRLCCGDI